MKKGIKDRLQHLLDISGTESQIKQHNPISHISNRSFNSKETPSRRDILNKSFFKYNNKKYREFSIENFLDNYNHNPHRPKSKKAQEYLNKSFGDLKTNFNINSNLNPLFNNNKLKKSSNNDVFTYSNKSKYINIDFNNKKNTIFKRNISSNTFIESPIYQSKTKRLFNQPSFGVGLFSSKQKFPASYNSGMTRQTEEHLDYFSKNLFKNEDHQKNDLFKKQTLLFPKTKKYISDLFSMPSNEVKSNYGYYANKKFDRKLMINREYNNNRNEKDNRFFNISVRHNNNKHLNAFMKEFNINKSELSFTKKKYS